MGNVDVDVDIGAALFSVVIVVDDIDAGGVEIGAADVVGWFEVSLSWVSGGFVKAVCESRCAISDETTSLLECDFSTGDCEQPASSAMGATDGFFGLGLGIVWSSTRGETLERWEFIDIVEGARFCKSLDIDMNHVGYDEVKLIATERKQKSAGNQRNIKP